MENNCWNVSPRSIGGRCGVYEGGVPVSSHNFETDAVIMMGPLVATERFVYFVDNDSERLVEWDVKKLAVAREIDIDLNFICMNSMLVDEKYIFTGYSFLDLDSWSWSFSLMDLVSVSDSLQHCGISENLSVFSEFSSCPNKYYRIVNSKVDGAGILVVNKSDFSVEHISCSISKIYAEESAIWGSYKNSIFMIKGEELVWEYFFDFSITYSLKNDTSFFVNGETLVAYSRQGSIVCLDKFSGFRLWESNVTKLLGVDVPVDNVCIVRACANNDVAIFSLGAGYRCTFAVDIKVGVLLWYEEEDYYSEKIGHCISGDLLFTCNKINGIPVAKDCYTGNAVWEHGEPFDGLYTSIASGHFLLYTGTYFQGCLFEWNKPYVSPYRIA